MNLNDQSARSRIIVATADCIERDGIAQVTIRKIAAEAGVNIAAVNYYFGTKAKLLETTLSRTLREGLGGSLDEFDDLIETMNGDVRAALPLFLTEIFGNMLNYPRLMKAQLHEALTHQDYDTPAIRELNTFLERFLGQIRSVLPEASDDDLRITVVQMWAGMMFLGMLPKSFAEFAGSDANQPAWQERYIVTLLERYLAPEG